MLTVSDADYEIPGPVGEFPDVPARSGVAAVLQAATAVEGSVRRMAAALDEIRAIAAGWAGQPNDYDEDTEQQIADGRAILEILQKRGL